MGKNKQTRLADKLLRGEGTIEDVLEMERAVDPPFTPKACAAFRRAALRLLKPEGRA